MSFSERLQTLIRVCRVKNADIARGVATDPSLVSRWRTGDRLPADIAGTARSLARYFARVPLLSEDRKQLLALVELRGEDEGELAAAVEAYLLEALMPDESVLSPAFTGGLFSSFEEILKIKNPGALTGVSFFPYVRTGMASEHELFLGGEGRRRAALNFFHLALSARSPVDIYLMNNGGDAWIYEDAAFLPLWQKGLSAMARAGHQLHILLPSIDEAQTALKAYLPVVPHAKAEFFALEGESEAAPSLFVARGLGSVLSFGLGDGAHTLFFKNPRDSETFFELLGIYLKRAAPVFTFAADGGEGYLEKLLQFEDRSGPFYALRHMFPALLFAPESLRSADGRGEFMLRRQENFYAKLREAPWFEFVSTAALTGAERRSGLVFPPDEAPRRELLRDEACAYLGRLAELLEREPNFHLAFVEPPTALTVLCKPEAGALFTAEAGDGARPSVRAGEPGLMASVGSYFDKLCETHAGPEARARTAERLTELAAFIRGDFGEGYLEL